MLVSKCRISDVQRWVVQMALGMHLIMSVEVRRVRGLFYRHKKMFTYLLKKRRGLYYMEPGCARWGASGALYPKSALCGTEFPLEG
jgi:hypothetical protein